LLEAREILASSSGKERHRANFLLRTSLRQMGDALTGNLLDYDLVKMLLGIVIMAVVRSFNLSVENVHPN
jgi:energy-converting hydrogenase Eha subunit H